MTDQVTTLGLGVDTSSVKAGERDLDAFAKAGTRAETAATALEKAGKSAADGLASAGRGAASANGAQEALGRNAKGAADSLGKQAAAAKLTGYQTSQLSAQLQDLFVQIQAGQSPVTALVQQGSQLSAVFGGARGALGALRTLITPTTLGLTALASGAALLFTAMDQVNREQGMLALSLAESGNAAGTTKSQLGDYARQVASVTGTVGAATEALAQLVQSGEVMGTDLPRFATVAMQAQRLLGFEVSKSVSAYAALGRDPVRASQQLNEQTRFLTASLAEQIRTLNAAGDSRAAASVAQNAYADAQARLVREATANLGTLERAWMKVTDVSKGAWDAMVAIGRPETLQQQLEKANAYLDSTARRGVNSVEQLKRRAAVADLKDALQESQRLLNRGAADALDSTRANEDALDALTGSRQSARAALIQAGAARQLAALELGLSQRSAATALAFQRDEVDAKAHQAELLRIDTERVQGQIANLEALRAAELTRKPTNVDETLRQQAALVDLDARRLQLQERLVQLRASEARGERDIAPKARSGGAADDLRAFKAIDEGNVVAYFREQALAENTASIALRAYASGLAAEAEARAQRYESQLAGVALSDRERTVAAALADEQARYASEVRKLNDELGSGRIDRALYEKKLQELESYHAGALNSEEAFWQSMAEAQRDWSNGAARAFKNYADRAANASQQVEESLTNGLQQGEDALASWLAGNKSAFRSFADFARMELSRAFARDLITGGQGLFPSLIGAGLSLLGSGLTVDSSGYGINPGGIDLPTRGGRAGGGTVERGGLYRVNELDGPGEILNVSGRQYLMAKANGTVQPSGGSAGPSVSVVNHFTINGPTDRRAQAQIAAATGQAVQRAVARNT